MRLFRPLLLPRQGVFTARLCRCIGKTAVWISARFFPKALCRDGVLYYLFLCFSRLPNTVTFTYRLGLALISASNALSDDDAVTRLSYIFSSANSLPTDALPGVYPACYVFEVAQCEVEVGYALRYFLSGERVEYGVYLFSAACHVACYGREVFAVFAQHHIEVFGYARYRPDRP